MKIFIASSSDLSKERNKLKITIEEKGHYPILWEYIDHSFNGKKFQDYINDDHLINSDVVIFLFKGKIGKFTLEELKLSYNNTPNKIKRIYTYFLKEDYNSIDKKELYKILELQNYLNDNEFLYKEYNNYIEIENDILKQLDILEKNDSILTILPADKYNFNIYLKEQMKIPIRDQMFIGREKEIETILSDLKARKKINLTTSLIAGGGVGKSVLAAEIAYHIIESWNGCSDYLDAPLFTDGILWIKLDKEHTIQNIIEEFIEPQIGVSLETSNFDNKLNKILHNKDILIVIDSAEQNLYITHILLDLFKFFPILVTSRVPIPNIPDIRIGNFDYNTSIKLFEKHLTDRNFTESEKKEIGDFAFHTLGGLPLAISIVAAFMKVYGRNIKDIMTHNDILSMPYKHNVTLKSVFDMSFQMLSPLSQKVFAIASIFKFPFTEERLLHIVKKEDEKINTIYGVMNELVQNNLIEPDVNNTFSFHPLVREYASNIFESFPNSKDIEEAKKEYLLSLADNPRIIDDIYNELLYIMEQDEKDGNTDRFILGVKKINWWLSDTGFLSIRQKLLHKAIKLSNNEKDKYDFIKSYGDNFVRQSKNDEAKSYYEKALTFKFCEDDWFLYYSYYHNEFELNNYLLSYKNNLKYARKCLFRDKEIYSSFLKTNSFITKKYLAMNLSRDYAIINAITPDNKSNKYKSLNDLISIYLYQNLYEDVVHICDSIQKLYWQDRDFSALDKAELLILKSWSLLFLQSNRLTSTIEFVQNYLNMLDSTVYYEYYDNVQEIKILYHLNNQEYSAAVKLIEKILNEDTRTLYRGIYESYTDVKLATDTLKKALHYEENEYNRAKIKIYLAKALVAIGEMELATKYTNEAIDFHYDYDSKENYMDPILKKIALQIKEDIGIQLFKKLSDNIFISRVDKSFLLGKEQLPKQVIAKDGKRMVLIQQGFSIYGEDNFDLPTIEDLLNRTKDVLHNDPRFQSIRYIPSFYIDEYPVTVREYRAYCAEAGIECPADEEENDVAPIRCLSIEQMQEYAEYYGKTLPLPEEWEKACRGEKNFNYPWGDAWDETLPIELQKDEFIFLKDLFIMYDNFKQYYDNIFLNKNEDIKNLGVLDNIIFRDEVEVNRYYFFRLLFYSLSLNTIEKFRVIDAIPSLSQFQIDELIRTFEEEVNKFAELEKEHPKDIATLFCRMKEQALDIIGNLTFMESPTINSESPYGVKNMVGNGYEVTLKEDYVVYKGSIVSYDYKEKLKGKTNLKEPYGSRKKETLSRKNLNIAFRCVKPIFSMEDLDDIKLKTNEINISKAN